MKLHAVIKGNEDTLTACIIKHWVKVLRYRVNTNGGYVYATLEVEDMETIYRWYEEDREPPLQEGTLLYWRPLEKGDAP